MDNVNAPELTTEEYIARLESENAKLRKINEVLVYRVETGSHQSTTPYAAFEHSVSLAELVRERTEELNEALDEVKASHRALTVANAETALVSQLLSDAIESISDAFVLFDDERCVVQFNSKFSKIWSEVGLRIQPGLSLAELDAIAHHSGLIARIYPATESTAKVYLLSNGRWIQMSERPTAEGGLVVLYTDISDLMARESEQREFALAQQSQLMKRTIDNLSQGIVLVNRGGSPELWNQQFLNLTGLTTADLESDKPFNVLIRSSRALQEHRRQTRQTKFGVAESVYHTTLGQILEIKTHPLPDGSSVYTFSDITERHAYEESLRQSEQWIRLITDNVPAMIAFVGPDRCFRFTNRGYENWLGAEPEELIGLSIDNLILSDSVLGTTGNMVERALRGENLTFESWERNAKGERRYLLKAYVANFDSQGRPDGFFVMNRDITERHQHAAQLESRVVERTAELTKLNRELESAKLEAEQANLSKTKFLAAVSHDLLQPLNAARLFTASLEERAKSSQIGQLASSISTSLDDVESLLRTLVDISKLDAGVVQAESTQFPARRLLDNLATEFREVARSQSLDFHYDPADIHIESDSQLLARILRNLLTNAIRYTDQGSVRLRVREKNDWLNIQVWDTGPGIAKEDKQAIFQEFKRLEGMKQKSDRGLGLGLAIVDKLSRVLNHPIKVTSRLGRGSMFSVSVPIVHSPSPESLPNPAIVSDAISDRLNGAKIWLIDNDIAICNAMADLLGGWGCELVTATSLEALSECVDISTYPVDLLIVDYHLDNDELGIDAAEAVVSTRDDDLTVLMITANYSKDVNEEIRDRGYLLMNKPVKPLKLKTLLAHLISQKAAKRVDV